MMAALIVLVIVSMAAIVAIGRAKLDAQRDRETQLLWVGDQYRQALRSYYSALPPGGKAQYPLRLEDLLEDKRFPATVRHLRRLYPDPLTGRADWVLEQDGSRIIGVHSRSTDAPLRHAGFSPENAQFAVARNYAEWRFLAVDAVTVPTVAGAQTDAGENAKANSHAN
jgi:type II secretory pathway pseudopilin PulG